MKNYLLHLTSRKAEGSKVEMLPLSRKLTATKVTVVSAASVLVADKDIYRS